MNIGRMLFSKNSCRNIVHLIATEIRHRLVKFILDSDELFAVMMDESTTMANETALIVYMTTVDPSGMQFIIV